MWKECKGEGDWNLLAYSFAWVKNIWEGFMSYHTFGKREKAAIKKKKKNAKWVAESTAFYVQ